MTEPGKIPVPAATFNPDAQLLIPLPATEEFDDCADLLAEWIDVGWRVAHTIEHRGGVIVVIRPTTDE